MAHKLTGISDKIPEGARKAFSLLSGEIIWLRDKWLNYNYLFGHSQERLDLLNEFGGGTMFYILDHLFIDDFILTFSRLTDPASGKNGNLSLEHLLVILDSKADATLIESLRPKLESIRVKVANIRKHRHKRVGHWDCKTQLSDADVLPPVSRNLIEEALMESEKFIGEFDFYFSDVEMLYDMLSIHDGAEVLHASLLKARAYDALEANHTIPRGTWRGYNKEN